MNDRALRIVVLDGRGDRHADPVTAAVAEALTIGDDDEASAGRAADRPMTPEALLHDADAAVVLDAGSLERAHEAGTPFCVALLPGFDVGWGGDLGEADRVLVAHERLVDAVVARGALRDHVEVTGPVAPRGYVPSDSRDAHRERLGIEHDGPLVLVPAAVLEELGPDAVLIQLGLASPDAAFLFDVGDDPEDADTLRRLAPVHGVSAWMFAEERDSERYWQLADLVVARPRGYEVGRALGVGAPMVLLPPGRSDALAAEALEAAGVARDTDVLATLSVTIDAALEPDELSAAREAIARLDTQGAAQRVADAVREAWMRRSVDGIDAPLRGLPHGLERLASSPEEQRAGPTSSKPPIDEDIESRIDRELAELKKRL